VDQLQPVRSAIILDGFELAIDRAVLILPATIPQICPDSGARWKCGWGREEVQEVGGWRVESGD